MEKPRIEIATAADLKALQEKDLRLHQEHLVKASKLINVALREPLSPKKLLVLERDANILFDEAIAHAKLSGLDHSQLELQRKVFSRSISEIKKEAGKRN